MLLETNIANSGSTKAYKQDVRNSNSLFNNEILDKVATTLGGTAGDYDVSGKFPSKNINYLHKLKLIALTVPKELGGGGATLCEARQVIRAIALGEPSTALIVVMQYLFARRVAHGQSWPAPLRSQILHDIVKKGGLGNGLRVEPELGTPARGGLPATIARRVSGGWSVSGRKIYSTGAPGLSWFGVWGRSDETEPRVGTFLVPSNLPGITIEKTWAALGMRATNSHDVIFDNVVIPEDHAVDIRAPAAWTSGYGIELMGWGSVLVPTIYDAVATNARDWLIRFLNERTPTNLGAPLASLPRFQQALGEIEALLYANRILLDQAAEATDRGEAPSGKDAGLLKQLVTKNSIAVAEQALALTGNPGIARSNPLERHYRDVLCSRVHTPQDDVVLTMAGKQALSDALRSEPVAVD